MDTPQSARVAGLVGALGGLLGAGFSAAELVSPTEISLAGSIRNSLFHLAAVVGLAGLAALRGAGTSWLGRIGLAGATAGFLLLVAAELTDPFDPGTAETLFSVSPLVIGLSMLLTGSAVLRARRWTGWRRGVPLVCGLFVFVVFLPLVVALGDTGLWLALTGWELTFAALGVAVVVEASTATAARTARTV